MILLPTSLSLLPCDTLSRWGTCRSDSGVLEEVLRTFSPRSLTPDPVVLTVNHPCTSCGISLCSLMVFLERIKSRNRHVRRCAHANRRDPQLRGCLMQFCRKAAKVPSLQQPLLMSSSTFIKTHTQKINLPKVHLHLCNEIWCI